MKSPTEMDYKELDLLLEMLLRDEKLPSKIEYSDSQIYYCRKKRLRILLKALYTLGKAQIFYMNYMKKQLNNIKKNEQIYNALKETGCLRTQRIYLYLSKIGLGDFASHIGGRFNDEIFANFTVATMLYDCAFDIPICSKYLGDFDRFIMKFLKADLPSLFSI